ncbi:MAG: hypothetical protein JWM99_3731 [Verrucomicrobiales bacterium]|jgi:hypothetical protein|nr:hypothetical protein [Verrucomicrobiales bacterium]
MVRGWIQKGLAWDFINRRNCFQPVFEPAKLKLMEYFELPFRRVNRLKNAATLFPVDFKASANNLIGFLFKY